MQRLTVFLFFLTEISVTVESLAFRIKNQNEDSQVIKMSQLSLAFLNSSNAKVAII